MPPKPGSNAPDQTRNQKLNQMAQVGRGTNQEILPRRCDLKPDLYFFFLFYWYVSGRTLSTSPSFKNFFFFLVFQTHTKRLLPTSHLSHFHCLPTTTPIMDGHSLVANAVSQPESDRFQGLPVTMWMEFLHLVAMTPWC